MVNTPSLPVVVPHGDDDSDVFVLFAASSSGPTKMEVAAALHHTARKRTRHADDATQTTSACDRFNAATQTETCAASAPVFDYIVPPPVNLNIASPPAATCAATATLLQ